MKYLSRMGIAPALAVVAILSLSGCCGMQAQGQHKCNMECCKMECCKGKGDCCKGKEHCCDAMKGCPRTKAQQ